jgi:hypothetical protein
MDKVSAYGSSSRNRGRKYSRSPSRSRSRRRSRSRSSYKRKSRSRSRSRSSYKRKSRSRSRERSLARRKKSRDRSRSPRKQKSRSRNRSRSRPPSPRKREPMAPAKKEAGNYQQQVVSQFQAPTTVNQFQMQIPGVILRPDEIPDAAPLPGYPMSDFRPTYQPQSYQHSQSSSQPIHHYLQAMSSYQPSQQYTQPSKVSKVPSPPRRQDPGLSPVRDFIAMEDIEQNDSPPRDSGKRPVRNTTVLYKVRDRDKEYFINLREDEGWCGRCHGTRCDREDHRCWRGSACRFLANGEGNRVPTNCRFWHSASEISDAATSSEIAYDKRLYTRPCVDGYKHPERCPRGDACQFAHYPYQARCYYCKEGHFRPDCPTAPRR